MAKPIKRNGKWTVRVYDYMDADGKQHYKRISADTKAECEDKAALYRHEERGKPAKRVMTVGDAIDQYITLSEVLSPTTIHAYQVMRQYAFQDIMALSVDDLTDTKMQAAINRECKRTSERTGKPLSAKSVKNEWGMIAAALHSIAGKQFRIRLPKPQRKNKQYPDPTQVMAAILGTDIELPCLLAMWLSFSMSEIRGIRLSDIRDGVVNIDHVLVDVGSVPTFKETAKVDTRIRSAILPEHISELVERRRDEVMAAGGDDDAFLVPGSRSQIYGRWQTICKQHGLELSFHDLRHMNASVMLALNVPEKYAMKRGGWKTPNVMKNVYQHTFTKEELNVNARIDGYFEQMLSHIAYSENMTKTHDQKAMKH